MGAVKKSKNTNSPSAGGVGSARGNVYQKKAVAWWLTRVLTQNKTIGAAFDLSAGVLPIRVFGQTEDPVDDVRIEFDDESRFFLQCKRSVSLSHNLESEFGKAWAQFCGQLKRTKGSANPVRCVLCYEESNSALAKLQEVFLRARQDSRWTRLSSCALTQKEKLATKILSRLHSKLLAQDRSLPTLRDLVSAVHFHRLDVSDSCDPHVQSTEALQNGILGNFNQTALAVETLDTLGEALTTTRGLSFDIAAIRLRLRKAGVHLKDIPEFASDLRELDAESKRTLEAFHAYHRDQLNGRFTLDRPIVSEVASRAVDGSLLVIGEPGAGKTGVLMTLAQKLKAARHRVWFLSVDGYKAESLPSLEKELNIHHRLTDIFGFAAESGRAVLLLDGLDAARDRVKQTTWRDLVREAKRRGVPVIATIRLFDLRHSQPWQELFPLAATETESNATLGLNKVRFTNVGELSDIEISQALLEFPKVRELAENHPAIRKLAANIYNFNLLCELAESGMPHNPLHTQLELLKAWWEKRVVEAGGEQAETALANLVERMVSSRRLQTNANGLGDELVRAAQSVGLIRAIPSRPGFIPNDSFEFTHNVLFDYAAFRCFVYLKRDQLVSELATPDSWGLFLRPSLGHFFTWLWDNYRNEFWQRAFDFQAASVPTLHKTAMWFTIARSVRQRDDFGPLLHGITTQDSKKEMWLSLTRGVNGCAEAAVWKQLYRRSDGLWWVEYACDLLRSGDMYVTNLGWQILYTLYYEIQYFKPEAFPLINQAARLEVETHWTIAAAFGPGVKPCIWLFCRTISGNSAESEKLIRRMLTPEELALSGFYRGHEVANEIISIARSLPDLAVEIYEGLYAFREMSMEQEPMGSSAVIPMQMSRHDMYGSAYHNLEKGLPAIFDFSPRTATHAVCRVLSGERLKSLDSEPIVRFLFNKVEIETTDLQSFHDELDRPYGEKSRLLAAWRDCIRKLPESTNASEQWNEVAEALVQEAAPPDLWAALLTAVPNHPDFFQIAIWPMFHSPDFLPCWHFKKYIDPCVNALAKLADQETLSHWQEVVLALKPDDLHRHNYPDNSDALEKLKSSYLLCLPEAALTETSRQFLAQCKQENVRRYHPPEARGLTSDEHLMIARRDNGLNPNNPLHLRLEKDLAGLTPPHLKKVGPNILKRIAEIEVRFSEADVELQSRLRGQFQNGFSWALRELAQKSAKLTDEQFNKVLKLCEGLLDTSSGRDNALEAISLTVSKKRQLTKKQKNLLNRIIARPEPDVIEHFGIYMWPLLNVWPEFIWSCLDLWSNRMGEKEAAHGLRFVLQGRWFWWLFGKNKRRALKLLKRMLDCARQAKNIELAEGFLGWFAAIAIHENDAGSYKLIEEFVSTPEDHGTENTDVVRVMAEWLAPREPNSILPPAKFDRAFRLTQCFFNSSHEALNRWHKEQNALSEDQRPKEPEPWVKSVVQQFNHFGVELKVSAENHVKMLSSKPSEDFKKVAEAWWQRAEPLFTQLEKWLHPHFGHYLIEALADWFPYYPARCLHWLRRLCEAGARTGMLFDRMIVSDVIKILQRCLAEHRDLLASDKVFLQDFASVLEALLSTANAEALGMAASLDEFYR
jgi:hypothetical protein